MNANNSAAGLSALVVDDDEFSLELLEGHLHRLGVRQVRTASDGAQALQMLRSGEPHPDFLVCDVFMPDTDGFEVVSALAATGFKGAVVLVSGVSVDMLDLLRNIVTDSGLKLAGACLKPVSTEQLAVALGLPMPPEPPQAA